MKTGVVIIVNTKMSSVMSRHLAVIEFSSDLINLDDILQSHIKNDKQVHY